MNNSICEHINCRYDQKQAAMQEALLAYTQDMELCMMFERVNSQPKKKASRPAKAKKRDFRSGIGLLLGVSGMTLFLVFGLLLGF